MDSRAISNPRVWLCALPLALALSFGASTEAPAELLLLDTREGAVSTGTELQAGAWYCIRVTGTYSAWTASQWGAACGTPEPSPQIPSPGIENGPVGLDAEVWFSAAFCGAADPNCCCNRACPHHYSYFWMNLDGTWNHYEPVGGPPATPTAGHEYVYYVLGQGRPASFLNYDDVYTDNYGVLSIEIQPATSGVPNREVPGGGIELRAPEPNPSHCAVAIAFRLAGPGPARLDIYALAGGLVHSRSWADAAAGETRFDWDGRGADGLRAPAGIYFACLSVGAHTRTRRFALIR